MALVSGNTGSSVIFERNLLVSTVSLLDKSISHRSDWVLSRFGWTGYTSDIHWMAPVASGILTGAGIFLIFLQCFNYIVDCYPSLYGTPYPLT